MPVALVTNSRATEKLPSAPASAASYPKALLAVVLTAHSILFASGTNPVWNVGMPDIGLIVRIVPYRLE